jgi:C4-dicarboxylate-specific signal transduction histidine kinase
VIIVRDITLQKMQERENKAHLAELAHITRLRLMGEMAPGIAHEVSQPLAAICSYTKAAINLISSDQSDLTDLSMLLSKIQQQALRAGQIIHRMREFVKSNPLQCTSVDINTLIRESICLCHDEILQNNILIVLELDNNLPLINVDHIHIEQVIVNLTRNSIEILQGLTKGLPRNLSIQTHLIDNKVIQVRVKDNGSGIAEDDKAKVLTPFFTTKVNGMGMGLSICRALIEAHDGVLFFNTELGKGTTFYCQLPLSHEKY